MWWLLLTNIIISLKWAKSHLVLLHIQVTHGWFLMAYVLLEKLQQYCLFVIICSLNFFDYITSYWQSLVSHLNNKTNFKGTENRNNENERKYLLIFGMEKFCVLTTNFGPFNLVISTLHVLPPKYLKGDW